MAISIKDSKTNSSPKRLPNLDILRGLAAGLIFLFHFFALYKPEKGAQWDNLNYYIEVDPKNWTGGIVKPKPEKRSKTCPIKTD